MQTSSGVFVCLFACFSFFFFFFYTHFCDTSGFLRVISEAWIIEASKIGFTMCSSLLSSVNFCLYIC